MKKTNVIRLALALAVLGCTVAFARPEHGCRMCHNAPRAYHMNRAGRQQFFKNAPEEIKNAFAEMRTLRRELRAELNKDKPDAAKAIEMVKRSEELHGKVLEWYTQQVLDGKAPKPGFGRRGHWGSMDRHHGKMRMHRGRHSGFSCGVQCPGAEKDPVSANPAPADPAPVDPAPAK